MPVPSALIIMQLRLAHPTRPGLQQLLNSFQAWCRAGRICLSIPSSFYGLGFVDGVLWVPEELSTLLLVAVRGEDLSSD